MNPKLSPLAATLALAVGLAGCTKTSDTPAPASREYTVQYTVSATSTSTANIIAYADQAGNLTQLSNVSLPATYTFKRTMKTGDGVNIVASIVAPVVATTITATILLDGKSVKNQTGSSAGGGSAAPSATANIVYVIP